MSKESWLGAYERGLAQGMTSGVAAATAPERMSPATDLCRLADLPVVEVDEMEYPMADEPKTCGCSAKQVCVNCCCTGCWNWPCICGAL